MRLKNKETGEIIETVIVDHGAEWEIRNMYTDEGTQTYNSLAELSAEWEDAPEEAIQVHIEGIQNVFMGGSRVYIDYATAKEAWKAVEKLKAWKRLKDKGFKFELRPGIARGEIRYYVTEESNEVEQDLQICFGGEE